MFKKELKKMHQRPNVSKDASIYLSASSVVSGKRSRSEECTRMLNGHQMSSIPSQSPNEPLKTRLIRLEMGI
ncbi:hypothetical protein PPTG_22427 [Phytophthora nicotianae INRA-310]|uniref:Uncharacterized protein n=1 Tax=Phytophthora nicotianae (strain INRA-310) TaxID=761204 RepID=W2QIB9_PHYN3|nr:hypothetical protein PPTG_22427 [Phytophthora nicotianae INRA-310]ETN12897.1 hypothetical protein PPTG_22427 [Phytophthora nicotianae INRA-310]